MRQIVLAVILLLLLSAIEAIAQDQTPPRKAGGGSHFGAPVVKYTVIRDQGALMFGGRGGWNITPSLLIAGGGYGTMTEVDAPENAVPDAPGPLDLKMETFGFDLEYAAHPTAPTHLTLGAFFGGAALHYVRDKTGEQHGETDFMLILEPSVGVEQAVTNWLHLNLAASFRLVNGVEQPKLDNGDINGVAVSLAVKFGQF